MVVTGRVSLVTSDGVAALFPGLAARMVARQGESVIGLADCGTDRGASSARVLAFSARPGRE